MFRYLKYLILIALMCRATAALAADDLASQSDFFREGDSARSYGMGSAFVGVSDDVSAVYWNPAGLAGLNSIQLLTTKTSMEFFESNVQAFQAAVPYGNGVVGLNYVYSSTDFPLYGQNPSNPLRFDYFLGMGSERYTGMALAYAMMWQPDLSVGFSIKNMDYDLYGNSASATAFDVAALMQMDEATRIGVNLQNVGGASLGVMDEVPFNVQFGVSYKTMEDTLTLAGGYDSNYLGDSAYSLGAEYKVAEYFTARLGSRDSNTAYGFSVDFESFRIDYALNSGNDETEASKFSLAYTFPTDRPKKKDKKKEQAEKEKAEKEKAEKEKAEKEKKEKEEKERKDKEKKEKEKAEKEKKEKEKKEKEKAEKERKEKEEKEKAEKEKAEKEKEEAIKVPVEDDETPEKLPSIDDLLGTSTGSSSEGSVLLPSYEPQPERFPTNTGSYILDDEVERIP